MFLESAPGKKDWHPIVGDYGSEVRHFAGGMNAHWTTENMTSKTRVSLDFRILRGVWYEALVDGSGEAGGQKDVYREKHGYYSVAMAVDMNREKQAGDGAMEQTSGEWARKGPLLAPDYRVGYPFTVKPSRWSKILRKNKAKRQSAP